MPPDEKVARHRLRVLEVADALANVSEACRPRGLIRTQFSKDKRPGQTDGLAGQKDLPPVPKTHPQTAPQAVVDQLLALSPEHPAWGCVRLSAMRKLEGLAVSNPTIQGILTKHGMAGRDDRLLRLEERAAGEPIELSAE